MSNRVSSLDDGYVSGDLSVFPDAVDTTDTLYEAKNNAATVLKQTLPLNGIYIVVNDASSFPEKGLIRLGPSSSIIPAIQQSPDLLFTSGVPGVSGNSEMVYYGERAGNVLKLLQRGFCGSRQSQWSKDTPVSCAVFAEHHNTIKDAVINMETYVGTKDNPVATSLNGILKALESKFLAPCPFFRAYPLSGKPSLSVRFQNFSHNNVKRCLWDFGDGGTSTERNPTHTYNTEGYYTVTLNVITSTGSQGIATKNNYIQVDSKHVVPFFYVAQENPLSPAYSQETALTLGATPATFLFVDQTLGEVAQRFWDFGDGENIMIDDPNIHTTTHVYDSPGTYDPTLLTIFTDQSYKRAFLTEQLTVI